VNQRYRPITRLGLGGTGLGDMYHATTEEAAQATVDAAWDAGIRYFDTAPHYGAGLSEHRFGQALRRRPRDAYTLSSKVGRLLVPHMPGEIQSPFVGALPFKRVIDYTATACAAPSRTACSAWRSATSTSSTCTTSRPITSATPSTTSSASRPARRRLRGLVKLREEGVIKAWGLGVNTVEPCLRALRQSDPDIFLLAGRYTLMETTPLDELFPLCEQRGAHVVLGGPFNSGFLAGGEHYDYQPAKPEQHAAARAPAPGGGAPRRRPGRGGAAVRAGASGGGGDDSGGEQSGALARNAALVDIRIPAAFWEELRAEGLVPRRRRCPDSLVSPAYGPSSHPTGRRDRCTIGVHISSLLLGTFLDS
jgi:D-threo-aldose 1-dehydrogenase